MADIKYTLLSEGTTDKALIAIINWIFRAQRSDLAVNSDWSNIAQLQIKERSLSEKIRASIEFYPCDVLFVHRDSDNVPTETRRTEIAEAYARCNLSEPPLICVIPVKMIEAWLLFDEKAIRDAVGNPNSRIDLALPRLNRLETLSDPKETLRNALTTASELTGRRKKNYGNAETLVQLSQLIEDYSPLRQLPAFHRLEAEIQTYLTTRE